MKPETLAEIMRRLLGKKPKDELPFRKRKSS